MMHSIYHFKSLGSQTSNASNVRNSKLKRRKLQPVASQSLRAEGSILQSACEITLLLRSDSAAFLYSKGVFPSKVARRIPREGSLEPQGGSQLRSPASYKFVDYSLNQGAPAGHESAETPIGHESNGAVAGEGVKFILIPFLSTCDFHHKLILVVYAKWIRDSGGRLVKCDTPQRKEFEVILNIMEATPEDQHSHQGRQDNLNEFRSMRDACIHLDKAKIWLNSLRPRSIRSWTNLQAEFLKKFFPTHRTNGLKRQISNFSAKENEKFYECWERYMEAINACPHHGFDTWLLVSYFYDGMSSSMKQLLETMRSGKDEVSVECLQCKGWDVYLKEDDDMKAKLAAMTRRLEELELKRIHEVQAVAEAPVQVKLCPNCQSYEHLVEECPAISAEREMLEIKQMLLDNSGPITMRLMEIPTTQVGGIIQISHGRPEQLNTNSRIHHLNNLQVLNKQC
ncbi:hypothetical protein CK203_038694 [Vitis vinifera]|uniref:Retrotransposon gag domain-containing protein n=1 Tax=Vitis vinifera TaxID=29760 RepID=A0A438HUW4_VITVI|nr:hypothetical protein CK203_038694 [Vitis vinifera]